VGGDFYNLLNLRADRIGVMIGDVTSHGFGAALIMALVMAASGIHAESAETPTEVLRRLEESLADELASTEMFLTVFYAVVDPKGGHITFANAGHAHAFLVSTRTGEAVRLEATRPPLGLATAPGEDAARTWPPREAIICLFTDGVADALGERGERFGEERVLGHVARLKDRSAREILESVHADLAGFTGGAPPADDRTVVILKM
jgi:sigma-B regulation protein RsbU (phosphoserine phosphatase)